MQAVVAQVLMRRCGTESGLVSEPYQRSSLPAADQLAETRPRYPTTLHMQMLNYTILSAQVFGCIRHVSLITSQTHTSLLSFWQPEGGLKK